MFDPVPRKIGGALDAGTIRRMTAATYQSKHEADQSLDGFELDKDLSTPEQKIYHNPTTKETVVAHRGTKGLGDWTNNAAYLVGRYGQTKRYQRAKKKQQEVIDKYGKVTTTLGHSQGAIISRKLNNRGMTDEVINVNPATKGARERKTSPPSSRRSTQCRSCTRRKGVTSPSTTERTTLSPSTAPTC